MGLVDFKPFNLLLYITQCIIICPLYCHFSLSCVIVCCDVHLISFISFSCCQFIHFISFSHMLLSKNMLATTTLILYMMIQVKPSLRTHK